MGKNLKRISYDVKHVFREHIVLRIEGRLFMIICVFLWPCAFLEFQFAEPEEFTLPYKLILLLLEVLSLWTAHNFWQRCFGKLVLSSKEVCFRCFLLKPKRIPIDECCYVGLEDYYQHWEQKPEKDIQFRNVYLNTEHVVIYFSKDPYPIKYKCRANELRCNDSFIKFRYSDELCKTVIALFPAQKTGQLAGFYNMRQFKLKEQERENNRRKRRFKRKIEKWMKTFGK